MKMKMLYLNSIWIKKWKISLTLVFPKPSPKRMISEIIAESGTTIAMGRNIDFKLSGSSVLPAYPEEKEKHHKYGQLHDRSNTIV
jgi:hypothetical protein